MVPRSGRHPGRWLRRPALPEPSTLPSSHNKGDSTHGLKTESMRHGKASYRGSMSWLTSLRREAPSALDQDPLPREATFDVAGRGEIESLRGETSLTAACAQDDFLRVAGRCTNRIGRSENRQSPQMWERGGRALPSPTTGDCRFLQDWAQNDLYPEGERSRALLGRDLQPLALGFGARHQDQILRLGAEK